jgi:uncharacterized protein (TIGR03382 family)
MKKLTLIGFMMLAAVASQAVSISWKIQSDAALAFNGSSVKAGATVYLVYLGSSELTSKTFNDIITATAVADTATAATGKLNKSVSTTDAAGAGNYAVFATYSADNATWYNVSATQKALTQGQINGLLNDGTQIDTAVFSFSNTTNTKGTPGQIGGGWYAVPEPATGALALAGVALLFRRRKA